MRPTVKFLSTHLIEQIISEAKQILSKLGITIENDKILSMLSDNGAKVDFTNHQVLFSNQLIDKCLKTVPDSFKLYDVNGNMTNDFCGYNVHFTPGSSALNILDYKTNKNRKPMTKDYIDYTKVTSGLNHIASQSTAFIPSDVHENISDSYRLFLSLLYCEKPVVTGTFILESFELMKNFQVVVRGSVEALKEKPLTIFSCCPTSPLKWCSISSQNIVDCANYMIPIEIVSMPLSGFIAPVTLTGSLIEHTVETLSGIVISQLTNPGAPILYGGSPAIFDIRYETTPLGAIETMMTDCAYNEIGKYLGIPTQAYISLSDAKQLDMQAGLETGTGATLAALAGINNISGPGMLDFENCQSLEKLVIDNEICGRSKRLVEGIEPKEDFPSIPIFEELLQEDHLLISKHTRKYLKSEHYFPGPVINRANNARWEEEGALTMRERAHKEVKRLITGYEPSALSEDIKKELVRLMEAEAKRYGQDKLPERE